MKTQNTKCLVLNADYAPLTIISWQKAMMWSFKYENNTRFGVEIIDFYKDDYILGSNNRKHPIPAIVKAVRYFRSNYSRVKFSRKNLFIRDDHTCQYCSNKLEAHLLTYDHVIPKSAWDDQKSSPTNWTNIVTACSQCNRKKGNRTPKQAKMPLMNLPKEPVKNIKYLPITDHLFKIKDQIPAEWLDYLPKSYFL